MLLYTSEKVITQDIDIQADGCLILCKEESVPFLSDYGECVGFSSFSLPNAGSLIYLYHHNFLVFELQYDKFWYRDSDKSDGGWSLEQIDPHSPCLEAENWRASCDHRGGTPGARNSVDGTNVIAPEIDYINVLSDTSIEVVFNQKMMSSSLENTDNYTIVEFNSHPYFANPSEDNQKSVTLVFQQPFVENRFHKLQVFGSLNCTGVPVADGCCYAFGLPGSAVGGDVVINELLFDPKLKLIDIQHLIRLIVNLHIICGGADGIKQELVDNHIAPNRTARDPKSVTTTVSDRNPRTV